MNTIYYKITNEKENHNGFQYNDGLNILDKPFDIKGVCSMGGLYFTNIINVLGYLDYGINLREVFLPLDDPELQIIQDDVDKWRANKIILGKKYSLKNVDTFKMLYYMGADMQIDHNLPLRWACMEGYLEIVKFLVTMGVDVNSYGDFPILVACDRGHLEIVKYLINKGANPYADSQKMIIRAARNGHFEIVKYLISLGLNPRLYKDCALRVSLLNNHIDIAKYLISLGADINIIRIRDIRIIKNHGYHQILHLLNHSIVTYHNNNKYNCFKMYIKSLFSGWKLFRN